MRFSDTFIPLTSFNIFNSKELLIVSVSSVMPLCSDKQTRQINSILIMSAEQNCESHLLSLSAVILYSAEY